MKILLASSEVHPYSKTGGLADMVGALAKSLVEGGHEVGLVTPLYRGIREKFPALKPIEYVVDVALGNDRAQAGVLMHEVSARLKVYFIEHRDFFNRPSLYQEAGKDYPDNATRFIFFSKCVAHLARYLPWKPDVVHVHDWQAGLVPILMLHQRWLQGWGNSPATCLTIHNLAYQGAFPRAAYDVTNLPLDYFHPGGVEFFGGVNCLKAAITYADMITTVSPRYAREIMTEAYGCGLDAVLRRRHDSLVGVLNGVDVTEWNPQQDTSLKHPFDTEHLAGKAAEKADLQAAMKLTVAPNVPLFGSITRLTDQKGIDIQLGALEEMLAADMQFVLLGSGEPALEKAYSDLGARFPGKVSIRLGYDHALSHRIEAACDFFLMPSKFEPCGLNQMYSLLYGAIPVVRRTGGLDDSVIDASDDADRANGIKFNEYSVRALSKAIRKALVLYKDADVLTQFRHNAMTSDFTWGRTRTEYLRIYEKAVGR